jgi:hypothetical protein
MPIEVTGRDVLLVGKPLVIEASSPHSNFAAVFEDDGDTGYFYALDPASEKNPILNALQIYNVSNVTDGSKPSEVVIGWSVDGRKVALLINSHPHAVFDFASKRGYCRTGFPAPSLNMGFKRSQ